MRVTFWGTRGSIARPGPTTIRYGGNTSCVETVADDGTRIILDCGTGAYELGRKLVAGTDGPVHGHLLVSHTHWDHVQGFPFFAPFFVPGSEWHIYAPGGLGRDLERSLAGQMSYQYFPIDLKSLCASIQFHDLGEGSFDIGGVSVTARYLNHPTPTLGYRLQSGGATVVYASDHEPHFPDPPEADAGGAVHEEDKSHIELLRDASMVVHDTQYTEAEYVDKIGWGHTPAERAVGYAIAANVRHLVLFHHDPAHTDEVMDEILERCRALAFKEGASLAITAACEGETLTVAEAGPTDQVVVGSRSAHDTTGHSLASPTVLIVEDDPATALLMQATLRPDGYRIVKVNSGKAALDVIAVERPDLVLLDQVLPGMDGFEVARQIRQHDNEAVRDVPIVLVTGMARKERDIQAGFAAGVNDYLLKPVKPTYLRARVYGWLLRGPLRALPG